MAAQRRSLRERRAAAAPGGRIEMFNDASVTITGYVATVPKEKHLPSGVPSLTMRVGWTPRRLDRATGEWVDGSTSYATVICWRRLAAHASVCLRRGDPVNVVGRLSVREYEVDGARRTSVEIDASSIGHDLNRGVANFSRVRPPTGQTAAEAEAVARGGHGGQPGQAGQPGQSDQTGQAAQAGQAGQVARGDQRSRELAGGEPGGEAGPLAGGQPADDFAASLEDPEGYDLADMAQRRLAEEGPADEEPAGDGLADEEPAEDEEVMMPVPDQAPVPF